MMYHLYQDGTRCCMVVVLIGTGQNHTLNKILGINCQNVIDELDISQTAIKWIKDLMILIDVMVVQYQMKAFFVYLIFHL